MLKDNGENDDKSNLTFHSFLRNRMNPLSLCIRSGIPTNTSTQTHQHTPIQHTPIQHTIAQQQFSTQTRVRRTLPSTSSCPSCGKIWCTRWPKPKPNRSAPRRVPNTTPITILRTHHEEMLPRRRRRHHPRVFLRRAKRPGKSACWDFGCTIPFRFGSTLRNSRRPRTKPFCSPRPCPRPWASS